MSRLALSEVRPRASSRGAASQGGVVPLLDSVAPPRRRCSGPPYSSHCPSSAASFYPQRCPRSGEPEGREATDRLQSELLGLSPRSYFRAAETILSKGVAPPTVVRKDPLSCWVVGRVGADEEADVGRGDADHYGGCYRPRFGVGRRVLCGPRRGARGYLCVGTDGG
jgi:hypothetical protein